MLNTYAKFRTVYRLYMHKIPIHFDMETADPDDVMTLALLANHPSANLLGITVTPGGRDQVGLVKKVLKLLAREDVLVGGFKTKQDKKYVSDFHTKWIGRYEDADPDGLTGEVMGEVLKKDPCTHLLTGANLKNPYRFLKYLPENEITFPVWVGQGGFCGDEVVPPEHRLEKFKGRETCPTFNFGGCLDGALYLLSTKQISKKILVGKNVCHGVSWTKELHERIKQVPNKTPGMDLILKGMGLYLKKNPQGKKLHDPLAACELLSGCTTKVEVHPYREKGEWGSHLYKGSLREDLGLPPVYAAISYDPEKFYNTLVANF